MSGDARHVCSGSAAWNDDFDAKVIAEMQEFYNLLDVGHWSPQLAGNLQKHFFASLRDHIETHMCCRYAKNTKNQKATFGFDDIFDDLSNDPSWRHPIDGID